MVAVQVALCLTALMGVAALAVDGGLLVAERRHAQAAADAAAMAAAVDLFKNWPTNAGADSGGSAAASATTIAKANYSADPTNLIIDSINIPPQTAYTAYFNNKAGFAEVNLTYNQKRGFSGIWSSAAIPVKAHAVARGQWRLPGQGVITLDPTAKNSLNLNGTGTLLTVQGGTIVVDSNNGNALTSGGTMTATGINITGGYTGGGTFTPTPVTGTPAVEDPLKALPTPSPPAAGTISKVSLTKGNFQYTLTPGSYDGNGGPAMPNVSSGDQIIFKQASANSAGGIYYLYAGLSSTGANLTMDSGTSGGIMFYNAGSGSSQSLSISGNATGTVNLSALTSGIYQGILYFQARGSTQDVTVSGNGSFTMLGTFYAPNAGLKVTGNGTSPVTIGSQYISDSLTIGGGGQVIVNYSSGLVAPVRYLSLVE
jgi:hypothetical protein